MDYVDFLLSVSDLNWVFKHTKDLQEFLNKIVTMLATQVGADLCAIYLYEDNLNTFVIKSSTHKCVYPENLPIVASGGGFTIGALDDGGFASGRDKPKQRILLKKNTGIAWDEGFQIAIPIMRGISPVGLIVAKKTGKKAFSHSQKKILKVLASQLSNILEISRELIEHVPSRDKTVDQSAWLGISKVTGDSGSSGSVLASAVVYDARSYLRGFKKEQSSKGVSIDDLEVAVKKTQEQLEDLQVNSEKTLAAEASLIFAAHLLMLRDGAFMNRIMDEAKISNDPIGAVVNAAKYFMDIFAASPDSYIAEKAHDIEDLAVRILRNLSDENFGLPDLKGRIVIAPGILASDLMRFRAEEVAGLILTSGGTTSHVAILSRSFGIPLLFVDNPELLHVEGGTLVYVDSDSGFAHLNPDEESLKKYKHHIELQIEKGREEPVDVSEVMSLDGQRVDIFANINLFLDLDMVRKQRVMGIGLYRTEFSFMLGSSFPSEEEQFAIYKRIADAAPDGPLTFRTLDVGGDKVLSYYSFPQEKNPFLGMRSLRFSLSNPDVFKDQLRAVLRAGIGKKLRIMFPMVSSVEDFVSARSILQECMEELNSKGVEYHKNPEIGLMVEVPSAVFVARSLAREADFLSIGTNDLVQYMLAVDRDNEKMSRFYIAHHPSVLRSIKQVVDAAGSFGKEVTVCGDMAHSDVHLPLLLGMGIRKLSMASSFMGHAKTIISKIDIDEVTNSVQSVLFSDSVDEIEKCALSWRDKVKVERV